MNWIFLHPKYIIIKIHMFQGGGVPRGGICLCILFCSSTLCSQRSKWTICGSSRAGAWISFACWHTVCRSRSEVSFMSKLEHSVATHCKWALMRFTAFIFCTVRQPYGSTEMSAAPAGANILQLPWWHCHQSFTYTQVIACFGHIHICVQVSVCETGF